MASKSILVQVEVISIIAACEKHMTFLPSGGPVGGEREGVISSSQSNGSNSNNITTNKNINSDDTSRQRRRRRPQPQQSSSVPNGNRSSINSIGNTTIGSIGGGLHRDFRAGINGGINGKSSSIKSSSKSSYCRSLSFIVLVGIIMITVQFVFNSVVHNNIRYTANTNISNSNNNLRNGASINNQEQTEIVRNSYDVLLKNTINYNTTHHNKDDAINSNNNVFLQQQIENIRSQISDMESKLSKYTDEPKFFPFVIRDSRHLTPTQINHDFHIFDYVDLTQAKQPKSKHSQLFHNARLVYDEVLEEKRKYTVELKERMIQRAANANTKKKANNKLAIPVEPNEAPCQFYSVKCYRQKILQVFSYVLRHFPNVEYYFYMEADNDLCVPMTMVKDLALTEQRYFINTGIGFSGWIMSRDFLSDFIALYSNTTLDVPLTKIVNSTTTIGETETVIIEPEIRPDVIASYYLTDRQAWAVTRQYWVSHTTLESLGIASLTVKDRRKDDTGERMKLDKHLPRCLEPRRGKWKVSRRKPYYDPRDRFGWDYFDYDVCPDELIFPCGGPDQLKQLIADDWRTANETGALARWELIAIKKKEKAKKEAKKSAEKAATEAAAASKKAATDAAKSKAVVNSAVLAAVTAAGNKKK